MNQLNKKARRKKLAWLLLKQWLALVVIFSGIELLSQGSLTTMMVLQNCLQAVIALIVVYGIGVLLASPTLR